MSNGLFLWTGGGDGTSWNDPNNWSDLTIGLPIGQPAQNPPGPGDSVEFLENADIGGNGTGFASFIYIYANVTISSDVTASGVDPTLSPLVVDSGGTLTVSGPTVSGPNAVVKNTNGTLDIGYFGTGTLMVLAGATVDASGAAGISAAAGLGMTSTGHGFLVVSGIGSTFIARVGGLYVGGLVLGLSPPGGVGTALIEQGGKLEIDDTTYGLEIGSFAGGAGYLTVTGTGSQVAAANAPIFIGDGGLGTMQVLAGGTVNADGGSQQ
jgi:subtilase-type serine protease